jgi:plasmid stabilization system protein ParE
MSEVRLSPEAEAELDGIWIHVARASGSADIATSVVEAIVERFWLLARHPYIGRRRDGDLRPDLRSPRRAVRQFLNDVVDAGLETRRFGELRLPWAHVFKCRLQTIGGILIAD